MNQMRIGRWLICGWLLLCIDVTGVTMAAGGRVSLHVKEAPLSTVVDSIGRSAGLSVVGTDTLSGKVSVRLKDADGKAALEMLAKDKLFSLQEEADVLVVDGRGMGEAKPCELAVLSPQHIRPEALAEALSTVIDKSHVRVLAETNQVLVAGSRREQGLAKNVCTLIDQVPKQVQLEVAVIAVEHSWVREMGVQWQWHGVSSRGGKDGGEAPHIRFGKAAANNPFQWAVDPQVQAKEELAGSVVIAKPSIITMNGQEANILIGERVPVLVETKKDGESSTTVSYQEAGIKLAYTPHVTEDGCIDADLRAEVSSPSLVPELKAYRITTRQASTRVRLQDGDVFVIGGLLDHRQGNQHGKIPILGDIPLVGKLFQHARKTKDKVELYILVKAHTL